MKTLTTLLVALTLATPAVLSAAGFEGTVKMKLTQGKEQSMPMTLRMKSGMTRVEMEAGGQSMATIIDPAKQQAIILMPEQQMYMVQSFGEAAQKAADKPEDVSLEKTNVHEKILGYDTTKYIAKTKDATTEIWGTEELGAYLGSGGGAPLGGRPGAGNSAGQAWEKLLKGKNIFPLRVVSKSSDGTMQMETTEVKKESLPDSLFTPPAGYQKFDMGGMMRGMGMPGMPGRR